MDLQDISNKFTKETLDSIIHTAGGIKSTSHLFGKAFGKGDSYLSKVFRLRVVGVKADNVSPVEVNLIVKAMPNSLGRRKVFRSAVFFRNEIHFYTKVIPAWEKFQNGRQPKNPFTEYPKCYAYYCDGFNDFIALEDVSFLGYEAPKRQDYISLEDCLLVLRSLGRFHAISLAFKALEPENFQQAVDNLEETYYDETYRDGYTPFLLLACKVANDAVQKTYPNTNYSLLSSEFLKDGSALYDDMIKLVSTRTELAVVGHGDCWTPNFLTRFNTETHTPEALKIIDFQLARFGSLTLDLMFFIYSCTSQEMREKSFDDLLKEYHRSACDLITDLGANPEIVLPWSKLLEELKNFGRFGCGMGIESLPMSLIEDEEVADLDALTEDSVLTDVWNITPFKEVHKQQRIAGIFKHAIDQGYIK